MTATPNTENPVIVPQPLEPMHFPLHGTRLIEASAGTGKTFTIASLYLRLLLGHGQHDAAFPHPLTVDQILVVTFTEAATAELRDRIRRRIHEARLAFSRGASDDPVLKHLLADLPDHARSAAILLQAERQMDEAAIFTIHGFCQRMLTQNAFESGSLFTNEFITEESQLRAQVAADYWRRNFYPLTRELANEIRRCWPAPDALLKEINPFLSGAPITLKAPPLSGDLAQLHQQNLQRIEAVKQGWQTHAADFLALIQNSGVNKRSYTKTSLPKALDEVGQWAEQPTMDYSLPKALEKFDQAVLAEKTPKGGVPEHPVFTAIHELLASPPSVREPVLAHAIQACRELLTEAKKRKGWLSFDDLLTQLAAALQTDAESGQGALAARIRHLYPVAMIDEFQDTDPLQYQIFSTVYMPPAEPEAPAASCSGLFMIGDPKQAIYAFRGADIFTYIRARRQVSAHYTLGTNWRSTAGMVSAANRVFELPDSPFVYDSDIAFLPVQPSPKAAGRHWLLHGERQPALCFWHQSADAPVSKGDYLSVMAEATAAQIQTILTQAAQGDAMLVSGKTAHPVAAGDIAVLVRTSAEAARVREALASQGIPSVYLSNRDSVFASQEATDLFRLLIAVQHPEQESTLRAAVATPLFALSARQLDRLNNEEDEWERWIAEFRDYRTLWLRRGVLPMLRHVLTRRQIAERLLGENGGERRLTDVLHLGELLQQASQTLDSDQALIRWLAEHIETPNGNSDEQQLRLESDSNLVQIVTIHKSKGLEYDLVFLPFVCSYRSTETALFHDAESQQAVLDVSGAEASLALAEQERLAEDLRLIYVALTRAVYGCYVGMAPLRNGRSTKEPTGLHLSAIGHLVQNGQQGGLAELATALNQLAESEDICVAEPPTRPEHLWEPVADEQPDPVASVFEHPVEHRWWITSYSSLVKQGHTALDATSELPGFDTDSAQDSQREDEGEPAHSEPARSIFTFPKGARPGTFLHTLFEQIEFTEAPDSEATQAVILELLRQENYDADWLPVLQDLLAQVLNCALDGEHLRLSALTPAQRLVEMEFMLPIQLLSSALLNKTLARHDTLSAKAGELGFATVSGMLKGFIDLVFEHQGKYYVLDWKSNWLGDSHDDYRGEALTTAMREHRYDLQYQLYALALHRFLKSRQANYDYEQHFGGVYYLFLRGVRSEENSGIFHARPSLALLTELEMLIDGKMKTGETA
ncbi:exodeoxyribonuclease V subunit beta [Photobacterium sp. 1_MG-2023]|uniref:exodeoxyribonuclease V subunit beta n=1 Tax=Photobacterium sp. 1_MG-2023 TaxID=3062646 RepID=UPI0026E19D70|nr:exodeoxyribonuclease V subunit beta [Photobacterium sp. 1_MG-2023]MDO6707769.1 exodeoxyribonuclease V subunit beta [Photobacterium sp. 1_MG-2023]